jgi:hypothetical protein
LAIVDATASTVVMGAVMASREERLAVSLLAGLEA